MRGGPARAILGLPDRPRRQESDGPSGDERRTLPVRRSALSGNGRAPLGGPLPLRELPAGGLRRLHDLRLLSAAEIHGPGRRARGLPLIPRGRASLLPQLRLAPYL